MSLQGLLKPLNMDFVPFELLPSDLGIDVPQIPKIHIGVCGGTNKNHYYKDVGLDLAHTHGCIDDPDKWLICIRRPNFLLIRDGLILKHEVSHVLTNQEFDLCGGPQTMERFEELWEISHGPEWENEMKNMGLPTDRIVEVTWDEAYGPL